MTKTNTNKNGTRGKNAHVFDADIALSSDQRLERLERFDRRQTRIRVGIFCLLSAMAAFFFWRNAGYEPPMPEPNYSGYYAGPWVNKNGDLISDDGKVIKRGYGVPAAGPDHTSAQASQIVRTPLLPTGITLEP